MKKTGFAMLIIALVLLNIRCEDNENTLDLIDNTQMAPADSLPEGVKKHLPDSGKYIYLTIDDAPVNGCNYIDSIIANEKVKTNIFLVGDIIDGSTRFSKYFDALADNEYMEIYNHSYSHANNRYADYYKNPQKVVDDFEKNKTRFNLSHKIARLPGRNLWMLDEKRKKNCSQTGTTSAKQLVENGYKVFGWDVEWHYSAKDYSPKQNVDELVAEIEAAYNSKSTFAQNHVVLLTHNQMFGKQNGKNNLGELIAKLKALNYTFQYLTSFPD